MRISELANRSGVSANRLRRYEALGLIKAMRMASGYREFTEGAVREAVFIAMSRNLGFSLKRIAEVLPLYRAGRLAFVDMQALMRERVAEVDSEIAARQTLRDRLIEHIAWLHAREAEQKAVSRPKPNAFTRSQRVQNGRK